MSSEETSTSTSTSRKTDYPSEIVDDLKSFHDAFRKAEERLFPLMTFRVNSTDVKFDPLDKARLHVTCAYALSSFFWMYLKTQGVDVKEHKIMDEMARIKGYMKKLQEAEDRKKAPHLNKQAAERFIQSSLWQPRESNSGGGSNKANKGNKGKRKSDGHKNNPHKKKRKSS